MFSTGKSIVSTDLILIAENDPQYIVADFSYQRLSPEQVKQLAASIERNTHLEVLRLQCCDLTDEQVFLLKTAILSNQHLTEVDIDDFQNDSPGIRQAIEEIRRHVRDTKIKNESTKVAVTTQKIS